MGHASGCELPEEITGTEGGVSLNEFSTEQLVAGIVNSARERVTYQVVIGRLAAELHHRDPAHWTFYRLADETRIPRSSLHRWAKPYLGESS